MSDDPLAPLSALPAVIESVAAAREAVDRVLTNRVLRRRSAEVSAESALRGAWAAAVLSGADVDLTRVRGGDVADPILQGALRVSAQLGPLAPTWRRAPRQVLARLHVLAAADLVGVGHVGVGQVGVGQAGVGQAGVGQGAADQVGADVLGRPGGGLLAGPGIAWRLDQLADTVTRTRAPAVVVAAVVLGEILGLDAFAPSSIVVGYAAARLSLVEFGLDPKSLSVVEVGALESRSTSAAALDGFRSGGVDGVVAWIAHVGEQVVLGAREAAAICTALERG